ncbi:MOSC domain-containing protein [Streptomyces tateyamensis]|uniref:MOSC domain-containing protein n=1 Tax=Streptomyces tateyamensis TaxID=565073 RepID=A0A2V4NES1_9ACTN|nr:MOSC N-terminal beta barrel domain-containing protein [Streptomyces tateyamensis]PYC82163.1 MOSC domain-containing protein [Streptomyces tateyamensis]
MAELSGLHRYPVKSMYRQSPQQAVVEPWGLHGDRRWMLARPGGLALTQRDLPRLGQFRTELAEDGALLLTSPAGDQLRVPVPHAADGASAVRGEVFGTEFAALEAEEKAQLWLREQVDHPELRLLHLADPLARRIAPAFSAPGETVSMADGFPLLATTTASLAALGDWLVEAGGEPLPMTRFRPNLVIAGTEPWAEEQWRRVRVGELVFRAVKLCGRCVVTTTEQETGERLGPEPLRTLAARHRFDKKAVFGVNLIPERPDGVTGDALGTLRLGDPVEVLATGDRLPAA